jgi:hypothetical protein
MSEGNFEAKLTAKRETAAGIYLTVQVQPDDYKADLATLRVGAVLMVGWAEVVNAQVEAIGLSPQAAGGHARAAALSPDERSSIASKAANARWEEKKDRRPFSSLPLSQQAAIRCNDNDFKLFLNVSNGVEAVNKVREHCGIISRATLDDKSASSARFQWTELESKYQSWLTDARYAGSKR